MMTYDDLKHLLMRNRTYRRFDAKYLIDEATLRKLVELTRFCSSGRNMQALKYRLVTGARERDGVFAALAWAGYFKEWPGPDADERPTAYIVQCLDKELSGNCLCDDGLHLEAITLGAATLGLGCCIIKSFKPSAVVESLHLASRYQPLYVLAIGRPAEEVVIDDLELGSNAIKYYRDDLDVHHVPKRALDDLII